MLSQRYEFKFPISIEQKTALLEAARDGLVEDAHGRNATYRVSSQYYDDLQLSAYWEKIDGEENRSKFRLRYYSIDEEDTATPIRAAFMEIKHRINNTVYKERVRLSDEGAIAILQDAGELRSLNDHVDESDAGKRSTIEAIRRAAARPGFNAVHVITYLREAFEGKVDRRLRITFDSALRAVPPDGFMQVSRDAGLSILPLDMIICEIKFDHSIPRFIRDITARLGIRLDRFSKFSRGIEALYPERAALESRDRS